MPNSFLASSSRVAGSCHDRWSFRIDRIAMALSRSGQRSERDPWGQKAGAKIFTQIDPER
jgi:hypothetical protein